MWRSQRGSPTSALGGAAGSPFSLAAILENLLEEMEFQQLLISKTGIKDYHRNQHNIKLCTPLQLWDVVVNEKIGNMFLGSRWEPQDWWINSTLDHDLRICLMVSPLPIPISVSLFIYSTPISTPIAPDLPPRFDSPTLCALPPVILWIFKNGL